LQPGRPGNFLRDNGPTDLPEPDDAFALAPFVDPTGDRRVSIADLLAVVQFLRNQQASALAGEDEAPVASFADEVVAGLAF
jgi:hypothetical protein